MEDTHKRLRDARYAPLRDPAKQRGAMTDSRHDHALTDERATGKPRPNKDHHRDGRIANARVR
jgi:hypothetical protein